MRKTLFSYGTLVLLITSVFLPSNLMAVEASAEEPELDHSWINDIVENLSNIVYTVETNGIQMGRYFGSEGERQAAFRIRDWMINNSRNLDNRTVYLDQVGSNTHTGTYKDILDHANNKIDIHDYGLILKNNTLEIQVPNSEIFPVPKYVCDQLNVTSDGYRDIDIVNLFEIIEEISASEIDVSYALLDNLDALSQSFVSEVVQIDDYSSATENETVNKVHLLEFLTNESEDTYYSKIEQAKNSDASGFIIITTNPSYIKNLSISSFGIAISPEDGVKIRHKLHNNNSVIIAFTEDNPIAISGKCQIYSMPLCMGDKKIGLIRETSDYPHPVILDILCAVPIWRSQWVGFILCNTSTLKSTHYFYSPSKTPYTLINSEINSYSRFIEKPVFFVNGTIYLGDGKTIDLWNWTDNDTCLQARFWINESRNDSAISYNVFCEVPGKDTDTYIMISGGHHDYFWGQGTTDNAVGTATMLGVLKYLNESNITPECNLIFVSWAGEEVILKGSGSYVFNVSNDEKNRNITYMINLDYFAYYLQNSTLEILATTNFLKDTIINITSRTEYNEIFQETTGYKLLPNKMDEASDDARPFWIRFLDCSIANIIYRPEEPTDLQIISVNKPSKLDNVKLARHRAGVNFTLGDAMSILDSDDLNVTADMVLNITKYLVLEPPENEFVNRSYAPFDLCGDGWNDSVNISFNVTTNLTSWATVKACLYNTSTGENVSDVNETSFTVYKGTNLSGCLSVTLFPSMTNGIYTASIRIYDDRKNLDDECHQLVNLYPYGKPIANFEYEVEGIINHRVNFTDTSMASPGADISEWYWDFDDYTHSHEQNPTHTYLLSTDYTVTLTVWDTNGFNDSWSDTIAVPNSVPYTSFTMDASAVCVGTDLSFTSTSCDEDGSIENYTWDFGDECCSYEENPVHSYSQSGVYTVTLMTTDDDGATNTSTMTDCLVIADALVDDDFRDDPDAHEWDTITEGLSDMENGGVIYVFNGSYASFEIAKSVSLYGESREDVLINSGNPGVKIRFYNVTVDGFNVSSGTIRMDVNVKSDENHTSNVTITNCNIIGSGTIGILLNQSSGCLIENCTIQGNTYDVKIVNDSQHNIIRKCMISQGDYGVYVSDSSYNFIGSPSITNPYPTDCLFTDTLYGVKLVDSDHNFILGCDFDGTPAPSGLYSGTTKGIYLDNSENNTISTCSIHDMTDKGMYLVDSTWNKIEHCKISWNPIGITFDNSPENLITQNHFGGNSEFAVSMPTDTQFNHVYYNDFFVNGNGSTNQTWDANSAKGAENLWNKDGNKTLTKTGDGEGNYWSDYTGMDDDEDGIGDTPYEINSSGILRNDSYPVMNPYGWCNFTQDSTLPVITNVSATPHTVGFGYNVTIQAVVTDNGSNISLVKVEVTYPDESSGNYTMECVGDSLYEYVFTDTWLTGQYNFSIWAMDDSYNSNSSSGHHFHVSAEATISIATLKNSYSGTEYINITDPPNPPENYTLVDRGLTWDEYYNADTGQNILEVSAGPINYQNNTNTWTPINNTLTLLAYNHPAYVYGYRVGNNRGLFGAYFKSNAQLDWPVAYAFDRSDDPTIHAVRSKLVGVGYVDPQSNWAYQYLQNVQSSQGQVNDYSITYPGVFTGTDVTWSYGNTGLKEEITLSNTTKTVLQNHPPSQYGLNNASSYLVFITKMEYQNLNLYNGSGVLDGNVTISDIGMEFRDVLGQFKCALPLGEAYELNNETARQQLTYRIIHLNGNTYLLSGLKVADLNTMTFPVVIDPTIQQLQIGSLTDDGDISNYSTSYTTVQSAPAGTVSSSSTTIYIGQSKFLNFPNPTYHIYRGYLMFNTSSLPENAYITDAYISLYKHSDYSTNDFTITVQNGRPTYPHIPLVSTDYNKNYYSGNGGGLNTSGFVNGRNSIPLTNYSWLQKEGMTKFCLRSSKDISGTTPTTAEYVIVYSRNGAPQYMPKLYITYRDQSKIKNTGSMDIKGYLLIQVQYYNSSQGAWLVEDDTINETTPRTITSGNQLAFDTIFNGHVRASDLTHGTGTYRVYAAFRDPEGNILKTNDGAELKAWWQFSKT